MQLVYEKIRILFSGNISSFPKIRGIPKPYLANWIEFQEIKLDVLRLNDEELHQLLPCLKRVDLRNYSQYKHSSLIEKLEAVEHLTACLYDKDFEKIKTFKHLTQLDIQFNHYTSAGLEALQNLPQLKGISLSSNITNQKELKALRSLTQLEFINFYSTDEGLEILRYMPQLKAVNLSYSEKITDEGLEVLKDLIHLKSLNLSYCTGITKDGIENWIRLPQLKFLDLSNCAMITEKDVNDLRGHLKETVIQYHQRDSLEK